MTRRGRIIAGMAAACAATASAACQHADRRPAPVATTGTPTAIGCPVPETGPVDAASVLVPGPTNGLPPSDARGEKLTIVGVVLDPSCQPAGGASLNIWHTDARGEYGPAGADTCCYYSGTVRTDRDGRFRLETIRPARYNQTNAPPAHIHLEMRHPSGQLTTEIVFAAQPAPTIASRAGGRVSVALRQVEGAQGPSWYGEAAFVLS